MPERKYVTVCPKCGSKDVSFERNPAYAASGLLNNFKECDNCGHHGMLFPEVLRSNAGKNTVNIKGRQMVQLSFGRGYYRYLIYFGIPLALIIFLLIVLIGI